MTQQQPQAIIEADVPKAIHTKWASVAVFGHELVSHRDLEILAKLLTMKEWEDGDHGVRVVMFRDDGYPIDGMGKQVLAGCMLDAKAITINLQHTWRRTLRLCVMEPGRGLHSTWHQMLIQNTLHELHHLAMAAQDRSDMMSNPEEDLEEMAEAFAVEALYNLAKQTDLEPSLWQQSPYLSARIGEAMFDNDKSNGEYRECDEWFANQQWMLDNRVSYYLPGEKDESHPVTFQSFKSFCQLLADEPDDKSWSADTADVGNAELAGKVVHMSGPQGPADVAAVLQASGAVPTPQSNEPVELTPEEYETYANYGVDPDQIEDLIHGQIEQSGMGQSYQQQGPAPQQQNAMPQQNTMWTPSEEQPAQQPQQQQQQQQRPAAPAMEPIPGLSTEDNIQVIKTIWMKVYKHIFNPQGCQPSNAHGVNKPFLNPEAVLTTHIELTELEKQVCPLMDMQDSIGVPHFGISTHKGLVGKLSKEGNLPMYVLTFNFQGGMMKRSLIPQNPAKLKDDRNPGLGYKDTALRAQQGNAIMHVIEADPRQKEANRASGVKDWKNKIENGDFHS